MTKKELERLFVENGGAVEIEILGHEYWISDYGHKYQLFSEEVDDGYTPIKELTVEETICAIEVYGKVGK